MRKSLSRTALPVCVAAVAAALTACAGRIDELNRRVDNLETESLRLSRLETRVDELVVRTEALETQIARLGELSERLDQLQSTLSKPQTGAAAGQPLQPPVSTDEVRPPQPGDLEGYVRDLPGAGPLVATIETSLGTFRCELHGDRAPLTVANFVGLARGLKAWKHPGTGKVKRTRFYDGQIFHRVIPGFMIQGGDPLGVGRGGPGYRFDNEIHPELRHDRPGVLSMANAGPGTNGSQFFIIEQATSHLDGRHTVFGHCDQPALVEKIARVPRGSRDRPLDPVTIVQVTISREP
ncbi:peptidylprolyl isomerase [Haliangium sp.]|uniref:peptidylprolyl isomerase n=1 Tax=Haliangium sp. TaxID=2663208 RepID=UPI003D102982